MFVVRPDARPSPLDRCLPFRASASPKPMDGRLMTRSHAMLGPMPAKTQSHTGGVVRSASTLTLRLFGHFLPGKTPTPRSSASATPFPPRPAQLALPLPGRHEASIDVYDPTVEPLFRETRAVEPVLSYEQASLQDIIPGAVPPPAMPKDRLILPGGSGLVLYEAPTGGMAFDWMQWSGKGAGQLAATIDAEALRKGGRSLRRLTRQRCVVPLARYSVPVRDGAVWSHRWIEPTSDTVACAAGVWSTEHDTGGSFAMVTGLETEGPLILTEEEVLLWLRAPLHEALAFISERRALV